MGIGGPEDSPSGMMTDVTIISETGRGKEEAPTVHNNDHFLADTTKDEK